MGRVNKFCLFFCDFFNCADRLHSWSLYLRREINIKFNSSTLRQWDYLILVKSHNVKTVQATIQMYLQWRNTFGKKKNGIHGNVLMMIHTIVMVIAIDDYLGLFVVGNLI